MDSISVVTRIPREAWDKTGANCPNGGMFLAQAPDSLEDRYKDAHYYELGKKIIEVMRPGYSVCFEYFMIGYADGSTTTKNEVVLATCFRLK